MSASDIEHAADEIAKFIRETNSSYIRILIFSNTKEIESIKKEHNLVVIGTPKPHCLRICDDKHKKGDGRIP